MSKVLRSNIHHNVLYVPIHNYKKERIAWAFASIEDFDKVSKYKFHLYKRRDGKYYVNSKINGFEVSMHEMIMNSKAPEGYVIDHRNSNGLDNRRSNLRFATLSQNSQNRMKEKGKYSSDYSGVSTCPNSSKFRATISYKRKYIHIGRYVTEKDAAKAYDIYAIHYYGIYAKTNNMLSIEEIESIVKYGIPPNYQKKATGRDLPKNIYRKCSRYAYDISRNSKRYYKSFDTFDECVKAKDELIKMFEKQKHAEMLKKTRNIIRNKNGVSVIYMRNKKDEIVGECLVDDNTWRDLAMYRWHFKKDGYCSGYVDKTNVLMHIYLYKKYIGKIPNNRTIDHDNQTPLDNRLNNLRVADGSLQSHNQKKIDGAICKYRGVSINGNKFIVRYKKKMYSFDYMEDAARKYNEFSTERYGKDANLNEVEDIKTKVQDLIPDDITVEYIQSIRFVELFKQVVKKMGWGGRNGHFSTKKMRITTLDNDIKKAISLLK